MKEQLSKLAQNIIFALTVVSAVSIPLFFLPTTTEFFDYNKFTLQLALSVAGLLVWCAKMIIEKRTVFTRSPLDIPFILLGTVLLISAFTSIDQHTSFFGSQGRIWPSFIPYATLVAFYFVMAANLKTRKQINITIWSLIGAASLASLIALFSYFGFFLPFDFAQIRSFNTIGVINKLSLLQAVIIPISVAFAIFDKDKTARSVATATSLVMVFSLILINFMPSYIGLAAALATLTIGTVKVKLTKAQQGHAAILAVVAVLFLVIRFVPPVAEGTLGQWIIAKDQNTPAEAQIDTPREKSLPMQAAWDVAAQSIGKRPLFGTGIGTYQFVYTQLKPRYINGTDDWAVRFPSASSDFTETIATTGIFGTLAFLLLLIAILRLVWSLLAKSQNTIVYLPLVSAAIGYIVLTFFTASSFATFTLFFLILGSITTLAKAYNEEHIFDVTVEIAALKNRLSWLQLGTPGAEPLLKTEATARGAKSQMLPVILATIFVIISALLLNYQQKAYRAEYFFRQSLLAARSNDGNRVVAFQQRAIQTNPAIDAYHRSLSQTTLNAAINLAQQPNLTEEQRQLLGQLAQVAIDQGKAASGYQILPLRLPGISAANVANWEALSSAYQALIGSVQGADVHATNTLSQAVALDPQNPILHTRLGSLYERLGDLDLAQRKYEDAIIVKGDYGPAHYALANILIEKKVEVVKILNELSLAKRFLPKEDQALPDIEKKLEEYNKQLRELQEKALEEQKSSASPKPSATPSPTPTPSPSPSPSGSPSPSPSL